MVALRLIILVGVPRPQVQQLIVQAVRTATKRPPRRTVCASSCHEKPKRGWISFQSVSQLVRSFALLNTSPPRSAGSPGTGEAIRQSDRTSSSDCGALFWQGHVIAKAQIESQLRKDLLVVLSKCGILKVLRRRLELDLVITIARHLAHHETGHGIVKLGLGPKAACRYTRHDIEAFIAQCRHVPSVRAAGETPGNL
jgi:hypothetical protein